ncbi:type II toxin-antitoxin system RelE/ParE family toxin [Bordetella genomosp. 4]|uniref:type II toxin-antitoxin system RelE/ParE family toxin n=1 Tax=Bordetella genomosp. 4 TaxID=463044 RepID=UPI0034E8BC35
MRVDEGAGYRVYFGRREKVVYILLCGGDKKSQRRDIAAAKQLWAAIKKGTSND